jgi:4-hydroxybenzoate polyprenyltransferase
MASRDVAEPWGEATSLAAVAAPAALLGGRSDTAGALLWAGLASTLHRLRRGEGALLAVNLSLAVYLGLGKPHALAGAVLSLVAIAVMYAFNDLYDAPADANNPKKDRAVVAIYLERRLTAGIAILALHLVTIGLAVTFLGASAVAALVGTMLVNVVYSTWLKGVPAVDVIVCGLWGALYAAIVETSPALIVLVGLMTAVCHLYQTLDDREPDAANGIITTAVRSAALSRHVLVVLSALLCVALRPLVGTAGALTAFVPLAIFFACDSPRVGWLLTKVYFGVMWLSVLEITRAVG